MLWQIILAVLFVIWSVYRWKNRRKFALMKQIGSKSIALPLVGHAYCFLGSDEDRFKVLEAIGQESYKKGGIMAQWQGPSLHIVVTEPEIVEVLLKTCLKKDDLMRLFRVLLGNGSIFAPVHIWRPRRKILAPTFSQKNLNSFVGVFAHQSKVMADQLQKVIEKGPISLWKYISTYTMDSVCETTLGINMNSQLEPELPFLRHFENCCHIDAIRIFQPWRYNDTMNKIFYRSAVDSYHRSKEFIWKFMDKIITSKWASLNKETSESNSEKSKEDKSWKTFLELLIESSANYGHQELREETLMIVLAGTDTSAVGSGFTTLLLAKYPEVQEKVYQELQDVFGDSDRPVTHEDLPKLKYLDAVIRESLRLYPPVPFITRKMDRDLTLPGGVTLLDGCNILVSIWCVHRNPRYWGDDAEQFRPERFIDTPLKHPAAFMPFSYGPRSCLGYLYAMMSMKTAIATLVRRYKIRPSDGKTGEGRIRVKFGIMLKPVNGFSVKLEPRTMERK